MEEWCHLHDKPKESIFKGLQIWGGTTNKTRRDCIRELEDFFEEGGLCDFYLMCLEDLGGDQLRSRAFRVRLGIKDKKRKGKGK